jgi:hypothetical protein
LLICSIICDICPAAREKINQKANELRAQINQDKEATAEERQAALESFVIFVIALATKSLILSNAACLSSAVASLS